MFAHLLVKLRPKLFCGFQLFEFVGWFWLEFGISFGNLLQNEVLLCFEVLIFEKNGFVGQHQAFALTLQPLDTFEHPLSLNFILFCFFEHLFPKIL